MDTVQKGQSLFGEFLLKSRKKRGWSLKDFQRKAQIDSAYLNRLERGERRNPTILTVYSIVMVFNIELMDLIELLILDTYAEVREYD